MRQPRLHLADDLRNFSGPEVCIDGTRYVAHRPLPWTSWKARFVLAWGVFIGKYDALRWIGQ